MAQKTNIRSIRFTDELANLIEQQVGYTFTDKFTNLITRCVWELPKKEEELERINREIQEKREELHGLYTKTRILAQTINRMSLEVNELSNTIARAQKEDW